MSRPQVRGAFLPKSLVAAAAALAMVFPAAAPALASATAGFAGAVIGADNTPAERFTVIYRDVATGRAYRSAPTDASGSYQVEVPIGARYKLDSVAASDGTTLAVQDAPPTAVTAAVIARSNVKFTRMEEPAAAEAAPAEAAAPPATTPEEEEKKKKEGAVPWWKKPGAIVGMVLGGVAIGAIALGSGGDDPAPTASASTP